MKRPNFLSSCDEVVAYVRNNADHLECELESGPGLFRSAESGLRVAFLDAKERRLPECEVALSVGHPEDLDSAPLLKGAGSGLLARCTPVPLPCTPDQLNLTLARALEAARDHGYAVVAKRLIEMGVELNAERDPTCLLRSILKNARSLAGADAGSLYVVDQDTQTLRFKYAENDSVTMDWHEVSFPITETSIVGACVISGESINLADLYTPEGRTANGKTFSHDRSLDQRTGYMTRSMLTVPMKGPGGQVLGVIQLINARKDRRRFADDAETSDLLPPPLQKTEDFEQRVFPFAHEVEHLCSALAAQGAVALENAKLYAELQDVFEGFVHASVTAIEQRDPTTSGHSQRVATLTCELAKTVDQITEGPFAEQRFKASAIREIEYAALLHDFGKVGVPERLLLKENKLHPEQLAMIQARLELMRLSLRLRKAEGDIGSESEFQTELAKIDGIRQLVEKSNLPRILDGGGNQQLEALRGQSFVVPGEETARLVLSDEEIDALLIPRGSLTKDERSQIQMHVQHTYNFLCKIPWGKDLSSLADIAWAHHEYLDGSGYPRGVGASSIPVQARMMTIADIFDALTASDRPYKKAVPVERALSILEMERDKGKLDPELLKIFIEGSVFRVIDFS